MTLAYKDFGKKTVNVGTIIKVVTTTAIPFDDALCEANAWIEEERRNIQLVSVETVRMGETISFLRVWYVRRSGGEQDDE